ncbi:MAG TPA: hypothetical protein PK719_04005 [Bacteroidales bacterium]|jgi:hypothetical protein|nr:hypothetical protein [Bacteroidales bacterium]HQG62796.1 hypothetical protein [Bacteroidales bacterium]HQK67093.1 hypothetical protein [Bacteroidales bacterium]
MSGWKRVTGSALAILGAAAFYIPALKAMAVKTTYGTAENS